MLEKGVKIEDVYEYFGYVFFENEELINIGYEIVDIECLKGESYFFLIKVISLKKLLNEIFDCKWIILFIK